MVPYYIIITTLHRRAFQSYRGLRPLNNFQNGTESRYHKPCTKRNLGKEEVLLAACPRHDFKDSRVDVRKEKRIEPEQKRRKGNFGGEPKKPTCSYSMI